MSIQKYAESIYAGVLGKLIGVYLGRPVEGWAYEDIRNRFDEVHYYVNSALGAPLVVADDDISGTFGFFRSVEDCRFSPEFSARDAGDAWLNYIIEDKTILWWGGLGRSTEHTAYLRLKSGIHAPDSGSIRLNGQTIAEQIGAQIFMDAFAMMSPGDPEMAVDFVRKAASVSHDGLAVDAACFLGAMEALAFDEVALDRIIDGALRFVTSKRLLDLIDDVRNICAHDAGWRSVRSKIDARYGYDKFPGPCHIVPNHAMVLASLLLGGDSFQRSVMIAASAGWDTDCNAGSVGCLNGIRLGLQGIGGGADFRSPVADQIYVVSSDGGSCVTDAVQQSRKILRAAAAYRREPLELCKKRFGFEFSGATQGFVPCPYSCPPYPLFRLGNLNESTGENGLSIDYTSLARGVTCCISVPVFLDFSVLARNFSTVASPTLYESQRVVAHIKAFQNDNPDLRFYVLYYDAADQVTRLDGERCQLVYGTNELQWQVPATGGMPIFRLGIELLCEKRLDGRIAVIDLDWAGAPEEFEQAGMLMSSIWNLNPYWLQAWVSSAKQFAPDFKYTYCISHPDKDGVVTLGTSDWDDYRVASALSFSLHEAGGLVLRSRGHRNYYAAVFRHGNQASIICRKNGEAKILASTEFRYQEDRQYNMSFEARGCDLALSVDGVRILNVSDQDCCHECGGAGFFIDEGTMLADGFAVRRGASSA